MSNFNNWLQCLIISIILTVLVCIWLSSFTNAQDYDRVPDKPLWIYNLSRYYSPEPWQESYLYGRTYRQELIEQFAWDPDVTMPADWIRFTHDDKMQAVACPPNIKLWTKLYMRAVEWSWWMVVTCRDRGWAINGRRLDMYCWVGQDAVNERKTCVTGRRRVRTMKLNKGIDDWLVSDYQPIEEKDNAQREKRKICRLLRKGKSKSTNILVDDWNNNWFIDQTVDNKTWIAKIYKCIFY